MSDLLKKLLIYIISRLQSQEADISSIRLIKLLYLIDMEHTEQFGHPLTDIEWVYHKHGPYFLDWPALLKANRLDINPEEIRTRAGHQATTYRTYDEPDIDEFVEKFASRTLVNRVIEKWALEDTDVILEHVYGTEPMHHAQRGDTLDLSLAHDVIAIKQARETAEDIITLEEFSEELDIEE